jgi:sulfate adenylyltransferase large subunit
VTGICVFKGFIMEKEMLKFVIVGHVDHGKSTLIGRLLYDTNSLPDEKIEEIKKFCEALGKDIEFGYIMDHLEEERDQGITIDTAQIFFSSQKRDYVIIDAPGHVEFVKNMITGASLAEAAILIVDAEEGVREQTQRHAYILGMLGLKQVIAVINKMDLVGYRRERFEEVTAELQKFLDGIRIHPTFVIPISAKDGDNVAKKSGAMAWYEGPTVLEALDALEPKKSAAANPMRFVVQDIYNFSKRIVAGRVESGVLSTGDTIEILPSLETTKVKSIEEYLRTPVSAEAGKAIGLTTTDKVFIDRGNVLVHPDSVRPVVTDTIRANIFWMDKKPFGTNDVLRFRCATQESACRIETIHTIRDSSSLILIEGRSNEIRNREVADVTIRTEKPVVIEDFNLNESLGRFVLARQDTCAGGIVTGFLA